MHGLAMMLAWVVAVSLNTVTATRRAPAVRSAAQAVPTRASLPEALAAYNAHRDADALVAFRALAFMDSAIAETMLGAMYANGRAGRVDPMTAAAYWLRAAERGYPPGQIALARALAAGRGIAADPGAAYGWALIAAARGEGAAHEEALALAAALRRRLPATEAARRMKIAAEWRPSNGGT